MKRFFFIIFPLAFILISCRNSLFTDVVGLYEVSFVTNCETEISSYVTDEIKEPFLIEKDDYVFLGWFLDTEFVNKVSFPYKLEKATTLYAKWAYKFCKISYNAVYEASPVPVVLEYGEIITSAQLPVLKHQGYQFNGWYFNNIRIKTGYIINSDILLTASWTKVTDSYDEPETPADIDVVNAAVPYITLQPENYKKKQNTKCVLEINASTSDYGKITYQWYKAESENSEGSKIQNEENKELEVSTITEGISYFYCIVTNTIEDNGDDGVKFQRVKSDVVKVEVYIANLVSIELQTKDVKRVYSKGSKLDLSNLIVTGIFDDDSTENLSDYSSSPSETSELNELGENGVTITVNDITVFFTINVLDTVISVNIPEYQNSEFILNYDSETQSFSVEDNFDSYVWWLDELKIENTTNSYSISENTMEDGIHFLMLIAKLDEKIYSATAEIRISR